MTVTVKEVSVKWFTVRCNVTVESQPLAAVNVCV